MGKRVSAARRQRPHLEAEASLGGGCGRQGKEKVGRNSIQEVSHADIEEQFTPVKSPHEVDIKKRTWAKTETPQLRCFEG